MKRFFISAIICIGISVIGVANNSASNPTDENISSAIVEQPTISTLSGGISLTTPSDKTTKFLIYSITGQVIKTITVSSGEVIVELPKGYYIVKCENWSKQAIVR